MLPYITLLAVLIFLLLKLSGFLDDLAQRAQNRDRQAPGRRRSAWDREIERRLEVFREFLEEPPNDDVDRG